MGFSYLCMLFYRPEKEGSIADEKYRLQYGKNPPRTPPALKKKAVRCRDMKGYCGYGENLLHFYICLLLLLLFLYYSFYLYLCIINKKRINSINIDIYREKAKS
jgi:hypothetical protein